MIVEAVTRLMARNDLSRDETRAVMNEIVDGKASAAQIGAFLAALAVKGETAEELTGAALVMRERAERIRVPRDVFIDTCGTGGDGQNTFNISTTVAFVAAGAGVAVAKHGNRRVSSQCGSADVLAALGVEVDLPPDKVERCVAEAGIGFLFAARLHPAFGAVASVRRELGVRTLFNLLGPLVNPAGARHQVLGVFAAKWVPVVGRVLADLGARHAFVVHGDGLDEISVSGETQVCEVTEGRVHDFTLTPEALGLGRHPRGALTGGDPAQNARILRDVLSGQRGGPRDAVLANAAAALVVGGAAVTLEAGVKRAAESIDSGAAADALARLVRISREGLA
ncbi:MAG: anthranilate phosphoribosyltransferase [Myxococcaceae bacterium]